MTISAPPTSPSRADGDNFDARAEAFLQWFATMVTQFNADNATIAGNAASAAASALTAVNAPGTNGTSTTSASIAAGSKSFTTQTGKAWVVGMFLTIAQTSAVANWMHGQITAYNSGTGALTVNVTNFEGAGTITDWTISLAPPINLGKAAAADIWAGISNALAITPSALAAAAAFVGVADAATITLDLTTGQNFKLTSGLGGNRTIANPSNMAAGQIFAFYLPQDATGGRTLTWGSKWKFFGGTPTPSSTPSAIDMVSGIVFDTNNILCVYNKAAG